jgi:predicted transcriptional regulator
VVTLFLVKRSVMSTTSLKLPEDLKMRASTAAEELGISTHAFMVGAIRQAADAVEQRTQFVAQAKAARDGMLEGGQGHDADAVRAYLRARLADPAATRPAPTSWRK